MKPYIKLKGFSPRSLAKKEQDFFLNKESLPLEYLNEVACFETLRVYGGRIFSPEAHHERLKESCKAIGKSFPWTSRDLCAHVLEAVQESGYPDAVLRVSMHWSSGDAGCAVLMVRPFKNYPKELYEKGVALKCAVSRRWTLRAQEPQIKSSQFIGGVLAHLDAVSGALYHELIFLNQSGLVAEGSVSNLFMVQEKTLLTPSVASGILKGVTRSVVISLAREAGIPVLETAITRHEMYSAKECFMTNTSSEVLPVVSVDGRSIGSGVPGVMTQKIMRLFEEKKWDLLF